MKLRFFLLVIVALVLLTGCERDATALLERAEACLPARLDSAEVYLDSVKQIERLNDASRALYGLLRAYTDNRRGKEIKSDSLIRDSYEYYREASHAGQTSDMTLLRRYARAVRSARTGTRAIWHIRNLATAHFGAIQIMPSSNRRRHWISTTKLTMMSTTRC